MDEVFNPVKLFEESLNKKELIDITVDFTEISLNELGCPRNVGVDISRKQ